MTTERAGPPDGRGGTDPRARLQVGVETSCRAPARLELLKLRLARWMGARSLFFPDHLMASIPGQGAGSRDPGFLDPFVMLGAAAMRHPGARLGVGVTDPARRHPAVLAQSALTLDHLARGGAVLGLGTGARENLVPWGLPAERRAGRLEEALTVIRRLWDSGGEPVSFDGVHFALRDATLGAPGRRRPAIWLGAHGPRTLALAGALADGWYPSVKPGPAEYRAGLAAIGKSAERAGRRLDVFEPALQLFVVLGPDRRRLLAEAVRAPATLPLLLALPSSLWTRHGLRHPLGDERTFGDALPAEITPDCLAAARLRATPELLGDAVFAGPVGDVVAEVRALVAAGLRHAVLAFVGPGIRGARPDDVVRLAALVRRLRALPLPAVAPDGVAPVA
jgi:phthiodiolone/phenolphthiodiolone dimycocerosates ketoreductase